MNRNYGWNWHFIETKRTWPDLAASSAYLLKTWSFLLEYQPSSLPPPPLLPSPSHSRATMLGPNVLNCAVTSVLALRAQKYLRMLTCICLQSKTLSTHYRALLQSVTERRSSLIQGLHPEAHRELSQTWHTPDVGVMTHSLVSEIKRVICICGRWIRNIFITVYLFFCFLFVIEAALTILTSILFGT